MVNAPEPPGHNHCRAAPLRTGRWFSPKGDRRWKLGPVRAIWRPDGAQGVWSSGRCATVPVRRIGARDFSASASIPRVGSRVRCGLDGEEASPLQLLWEGAGRRPHRRRHERVDLRRVRPALLRHLLAGLGFPVVGAGAGALNSSSADSLVTVHQLQRLGRPLGRSLASHNTPSKIGCPAFCASSGWTIGAKLECSLLRLEESGERLRFRGNHPGTDRSQPVRTTALQPRQPIPCGGAASRQSVHGRYPVPYRLCPQGVNATPRRTPEMVSSNPASVEGVG